MDSFFWSAGSAFWLGLLTSISPCPLATNIAAISYMGNRLGSPVYILLSGMLYTLGRMLTYLILAIFILSSMLSVPGVSQTLQKYMNQLIGPLLILVGMVLLDWISLNFKSKGMSEADQLKIHSLGLWGAGWLGILFALSFCPISAALYFGSLIPLAIQNQSRFLFPALYGIGTALPVFLFALLLAVGTRWIGPVYQHLADIELWARKITGGIFILVGIYESLKFIYGLPI